MIRVLTNEGLQLMEDHHYWRTITAWDRWRNSDPYGFKPVRKTAKASLMRLEQQANIKMT